MKYGFSGNNGAVNKCFNRSSTCSKTFGLFFNEELFNIMCEETNRYAVQRPASSLAHLRQWTEVNNRELKAFLALIIMTGITRLPNLHHYW